MSVQQIIAQLNNNERIKPPSPTPSPTATIIKGCHAQKETNNFNSLLDKFSQQRQTSPSPSDRSFTSSFKSEPPITTSVLKPSIPVIPSQATSLRTPRQNQRSTSSDNNTQTLSSFDKVADELLNLVEELVERNTEAERYIKTLQSKVEEYASDVTKVRDYQIRVEYLATKLEQVSEERDYYESELVKYQSLKEQQHKCDTAKDNIITGESVDNVKKNYQHYSLNDFLGIYEQLKSNDTDDNYGVDSDDNASDELQLFEDEAQKYYQEKDVEKENITSEEQQREEISVLNDQLLQYDKGLQMTLTNYVTALEKQRLETNCLKKVIKKQDELITKLEKKLASTCTSDELLKEHVDLQKIELENKRELLSQLLNEREELLQKLNKQDGHGFLMKDPTLSTQMVRVVTPPLTAPPNQPLPPLPHHCQS